MKSLYIREIRWLERDVCAVVFEADDSTGQLKTTARLQRGREVIAVAYDDNITRDYQGEMSGLRAIVHAVKTFCLAAQGELEG